MPRTILIIEDPKTADPLRVYLQKFDFQALTEPSPRAAIKRIHAEAIDLVILDVVLTERDGIQVIREIRQKSDIPIILLTSRGELADRIVGLEVGADDAMNKPFEPRELVARIEAVLRRPRFIEKRKTLRFGPLEIHLKDRRATLGGAEMELTTMEFEILALLASKPGEVFSRDQIMDRIRGMDVEAYSRSIDVVLSRLRSKLKDSPRKPRYLKTVWGSGYTFLGRTGTED